MKRTCQWGSLRPLKESYNLHAQTDTHRLECVRSFRCKKKMSFRKKKETRHCRAHMGRDGRNRIWEDEGKETGERGFRFQNQT